MTAPHIVDPSGLLGEALAEASPDLMRNLLQDVINALLSADADAVAGAEYGRPSHSILQRTKHGRAASQSAHRRNHAQRTIDGTAVRALCGTYFVPRQDPDVREVCPACRSLHAEIPSE